MLLGAGGTRRNVTGVVGVGLVAVGVLVLLSGVALLMLVALAGAALGGAVVLVRRLSGRAHAPRPSVRGTSPLEIEADYEILRTKSPADDVTSPPAPRR